MGGLSDKIKIVYLSLVILFSLGVFVFLLDSWGIVNMEEYLPALSEAAPLSPETDDSPSAFEWQQLEKERNRIEEERLKLEEERVKLAEAQAELDRKRDDLRERESGLVSQQKALADREKERQERSRMIRDMADRMSNMPPQDAVAIAAGWSNSDLVDVFREMEVSSADAGRASIVPYLMTLLPRDRAALITTLMMDAEANRLPESDGTPDGAAQP